MKKHWFLVVGENGNQRASFYFAKDSMNISKSEIDERFKNHLSEMMGVRSNLILISNICYLGEMTSDEFLK